MVNFSENDTMDIKKSDIANLSIKKLKELLDKYNIDYSGIIEKKELVSLAINLYEKFQEFKKEIGSTNIKKELECNICMNRTINCVFIDCGHSMCCLECGKQMNKCPVCRKDIKQCFKIVIG